MAEMSAALFLLAKCRVRAARVEPPATPVIALATLPRHAMTRNNDGNTGEASSRAKPAVEITETQITWDSCNAGKVGVDAKLTYIVETVSKQPPLFCIHI